MSRKDKTGITSAGVLLYRWQAGVLELLLGHPGGPFWQAHDLGCWTLPKGEVEPGEDLLTAARREFTEETGQTIGEGAGIALGEVRQRSGKVVVAWAFEGDLDPQLAHSNTFSMEWPPGSGLTKSFLEIDRVEWFVPSEARLRLKDVQVPFVDRLVRVITRSP